MGNILMVCGVFWVGFALFVRTPYTFMAAILHKVVPLLTGIAAVLCVLEMYGWVKVF